MRLSAVLLLQGGQLAHAELAYRLWSGGVSTAFDLHRRQDDYAPEFGTCGMGQTCAEACGNGFEKCDSKDTSVLFCYNPGVGQTCCPGGSGRACDVGFYCVSDPNGGQEYCCDEQSNLSQCASDLGISTVVPPATTSLSLTSRSMAMTTSSPLTITSTSTTTTPKSSLQIPSTSTATTTSGNSGNFTTTRPTTSSIFTAEAPSVSAIHAWGMGAAVVGWVVMI